MADFSSMLALAPELFRIMPLIFLIVQITYYLFLIQMFGWVMMKGFGGFLPWHMKLLAKLGFGFIALVSGVALSAFIPIQGTGIFRLIYAIFQINVVIGGIVSTAVFTVSLFLISSKMPNIRGMEKAVERLKMHMEKARSIEKDMAGKTVVQKLTQPMMLAGIIVLVVLIAFSLANFRGFPNLSENVFSALGLNQSDIDMMGSYIEAISPNQTAPMPEGCVNPLELAQNFQEDILQNSLPVYTDSAVKALIESQSGESVELMYRIEYRQKVYALAITARQSVCSATGTLFCGCINLGSLV